MLRVTANNITQKRTIRPLYAFTQATQYAGFLDASWNRATDIYPGMVLTRLGSENLTLLTTSTQEVFGLSGLFVAPALGIDELRDTGTNFMTAWVGDEQATFEILAPAFDTTATWTNTTDGSKVPLRVTIGAHAAGPGKLTTAAAGATVSSKVAAHLIQVVSTTKIIVSLEKP